ncbi:MAG TPA: tRNA glutamyl-Q(34) synthetase GluQRS [Nevskiales bacterium]|nr:tRNA glutamyl-Q(34) synthetase GluQRS [Nevskiales bacterium]
MAAYRGRFAPSPTGPLHLGSLLAALASWLQARRSGGAWLLRMEDLDRPRARQAYADDILRTLERFGLHWDGPVLYQSTRDDGYAAAIACLAAQGLLYPCTCTRRELAECRPGIDGPVYPGTCRDAPPLRAQRHALRIRVDAHEWRFTDRLQGECRQVLAREVGDFILRRADGLYAYQLAVVVDDAEQGITEIVRGADLLSSTPRQLYLQHRLGYPTPAYAHVPVLADAAGRKLSKQNRADPVAGRRPEMALQLCLELLGQQPPRDLADAGRDALLCWARAHWDLARVPRRLQLATPPMA